MKCDRCGHENKPKAAPSDPCWMYQVVKGTVKSQMFDPREVPEGWYDSPPAAKKALEEPKKESEPKKIDGRSKHARSMKAQDNDNSTGTDK